MTDPSNEHRFNEEEFALILRRAVELDSGPEAEFALVFTSGIRPFAGDNASGPTEQFVQNYGTRVHHLAFRAEEIAATCDALGEDGMAFLCKLVGTRERGIQQIFSTPSANTLVVNEYIQRYGDFDGFFDENNVTRLTHATGKQ